MMCSPAQFAANRRNAARSTGPKTDAGKARSRANALKHGLAAETLLTPEESDAVAAVPADEWRQRQAGVLAHRIDRAHRVEAHERDHAALRAESCWDVDRQQDVANIAAGLRRRPDRVVARLRATVHGCDWLIQRWEWLARAAGRPGGWDEGQTSLALDLQGVPAAFRDTAEPTADPAGLAAAEIAALRTLRARLEPSDRLRQQAAKKGLDDDASPGLRRAIRYAADLFRRLRWCVDTAPVEDADSPPPDPEPGPAEAEVAPPSNPPLPAVAARKETSDLGGWQDDQTPPAGLDLPTACVPLLMVPAPHLRR